MTDDQQFTGNPLDYGWMPHKPSTWGARLAKTRKPITMSHFSGRHRNGQPIMIESSHDAGLDVKIVMVSRLGDVGITERLDTEYGYGARVTLSDLYDFSNTYPNDQ